MQASLWTAARTDSGIKSLFITSVTFLLAEIAAQTRIRPWARQILHLLWCLSCSRRRRLAYGCICVSLARQTTPLELPQWLRFHFTNLNKRWLIALKFPSWPLTWCRKLSNRIIEDDTLSHRRRMLPTVGINSPLISVRQETSQSSAWATIAVCGVGRRLWSPTNSSFDLTNYPYQCAQPSPPPCEEISVKRLRRKTFHAPLPISAWNYWRILGIVVLISTTAGNKLLKGCSVHLREIFTGTRSAARAQTPNCKTPTLLRACHVSANPKTTITAEEASGSHRVANWPVPWTRAMNRRA